MSLDQAVLKNAHRMQVNFETKDIAASLQDLFGQRLVAFIAGVKDPKRVGQWAAGQSKPRQESEDRLRSTFLIAQLLLSEESPHTVRAWFIGMNPQLDDESPAEALRNGFRKDALAAAKAYLAGG
jgi:hypothetical protein